MSTPGSVEGPKSRAVTAVFVRLDVLVLPFFPPHLSPVIRISSIDILIH